MLYRTDGSQALAASKAHTAIGRSGEMYAHRIVAVTATVEESSTSNRPDCSRNDAPKCLPGSVN